jgi:hypothetical protein
VVDCLAYVYSGCAAVPNRDGASRQGMQRRTVAEKLFCVDLFALTRPSSFLRGGLALCAAFNHTVLLLNFMKATIIIVVVGSFTLPIQD